MTARRPERAPLIGRHVRLDPLARDDLPALWRALGHPEVFAGGFGGGSAGLPDDEAAFASWALDYLPHERGNSYVVRVVSGPHAGEVVGTSSLADFDEPRESAQLGWTAYDPRVWGTQVNVEVKLLLLGLAFDHGFGRVVLQSDVLNARSRAAIEKIGARFEGVARRDKRRADGSWRDAAVFSVVVEEWPEVRDGLERRLRDWGERPVLYRSMPGNLTS